MRGRRGIIMTLMWQPWNPCVVVLALAVSETGVLDCCAEQRVKKAAGIAVNVGEGKGCSWTF